MGLQAINKKNINKLKDTMHKGEVFETVLTPWINTDKKGLNFDKRDGDSNPFTLGIVRVAASLLRIRKYQIATIGMRISSHKKPPL